ATLRLRPVARGAKPVDEGPQSAERGAVSLEALQRDGRRFGDEARKIQGAAGLRAGSGKARAAKRLHPDRGADDVAVDVDVARLDPFGDARDGFVDPRVQAEGEPVAGGVDGVDQRVERLAP